MTLLPYIKGYFSLKSVFDIERLYYNELSAKLSEAKWEGAVYLTFNGDGDVCPGLGWNHDAVKIAIAMKSHFK